jgi:hypothetical protein
MGLSAVMGRRQILEEYGPLVTNGIHSDDGAVMLARALIGDDQAPIRRQVQRASCLVSAEGVVCRAAADTPGEQQDRDKQENFWSLAKAAGQAAHRGSRERAAQ